MDILTRLDDVPQQAQEWGTMQWLAGGEHGNSQAMTLGRMLMAPGGCTAAHRHANCEEMIHLVRGNVRQRVGEHIHDMRAGDTVIVPQGAAHQTINGDDAPAELIIVFSSPARAFEPVTEHTPA